MQQTETDAPRIDAVRVAELIGEALKLDPKGTLPIWRVLDERREQFEILASDDTASVDDLTLTLQQLESDLVQHYRNDAWLPASQTSAHYAATIRGVLKRLALPATTGQPIAVEWREERQDFRTGYLGDVPVGYVKRNRHEGPMQRLGYEWEATSTAPYAQSSILTCHKTPDEAKAAIATRISEGFAPFLA